MDIFTDKSTGVRFCMKIGNPMADKILEEGISDHALIKWCKQFLTEDGIFVDIGAHIGTYSILLSKECKEVYAFEPYKSNVDCIVIGTCINNLFNIQVENVALGEHKGSGLLKVFSEDGSCVTLSDSAGENFIEEMEVEIRSLDSYNLKNVNFLKITMPGSELSVIKGASLTLVDNNFPPFIFDVWSYDWFKEEKDLLMSFVKNLGYKIYPISGVPNTYLASDHPLNKIKKIKNGEPEIPPKYNIEELQDKYEKGEFLDHSLLEWDGWHALAKHYRIISRHQSSYDCAIMGLKTSPSDKEYLFYEEISIVAYYINKKEEGFNAAEKVILSYHTPWSTRNSTLSNEGFYMSPLPVKKKIDIKYPMPLHYTRSSASIIKTDQGYRINIRGVNYFLHEGNYKSRHGDNTIRTINYLLDTDPNLNIIKGVELVDKSGIPLYPKDILGMEDVRLFGTNYFFCTYLEMNESRTPQIGWGTYEPETGIVTRMVPLMAGFELKCEKNWLPFIDDGDIYIIYAMGPFQLYKLDQVTGVVTEVKRSAIGEGLTYCSPNPSSSDPYINDFRGSANPIFYKNHWLTTIHQVYHSQLRKYFHRFVAFDKDFTTIKFSLPFYFEKVGIEFNLSMCESDEGMLLTYSHGDVTSSIAIVDYRVIDSMLGL